MLGISGRVTVSGFSFPPPYTPGPSGNVHLAIWEVVRAEEVRVGGEQVLGVVVTAAEVRTVNFQAGERDVDNTLLLDLQGDRGPRRDLVALGHCQLDSESDRLPGGHHHGERLHVNDVRTADRFIRPLTEAVLDLVDPDVPGGGEAEEGEEREQLHDEQSPCTLR